MAMSPATLSTELQKIANGGTEPPVRAGWAAAYTKYLMESTVAGISPASDSVLAGAKAGMDTALTGISTPKTALQAAQLIVAAIKGYWTAALAAGATVWVTAPPLVPAPFTLPVVFLDSGAEQAATAVVAAAFLANTVGALPKAAAYDAIAAALHPLGIGATVSQATVPSPTPGVPVT